MRCHLAGTAVSTTLTGGTVTVSLPFGLKTKAGALPVVSSKRNGSELRLTRGLGVAANWGALGRAFRAPTQGNCHILYLRLRNGSHFVGQSYIVNEKAISCNPIIF